MKTYFDAQKYIVWRNRYLAEKTTGANIHSVHGLFGRIYNGLSNYEYYCNNDDHIHAARNLEIAAEAIKSLNEVPTFVLGELIKSEIIPDQFFPKSFLRTYNGDEKTFPLFDGENAVVLYQRGGWPKLCENPSEIQIGDVWGYLPSSRDVVFHLVDFPLTSKD